MTKRTCIGANVRRVDGPALVTGQPVFCDDIELRDMLYCSVLRSPLAYAHIKKIDTEKAKALPGVACVLCHKDVERVPYTSAGQGYPEPSPHDQVLFDSTMRHVGDRVAAVAAETPEIAAQALELIEVEYEELPYVLCPRKAMQDGTPVVHAEKDSKGIHDATHNIAAHAHAQLGDLEKGFAEADVVVENEFELGYVQQTPAENHVCITYLDTSGRLVVRTSTQVPWHVRRIIAPVLGLEVKDIRVIKPRVGGAFGVKQEILLEEVCGILTLKTRRPVRWEMTRLEEFNFSRSRHPMIVKIKTGAKKDGTLTANQMEIIANTGAYGSHALTVPCNSGSKSLPMYKCPNVSFDAKGVYTNLPPAGAFRGYGAPQGIYALECQMDELAKALDMDPIELRSKSHVRQGEDHSLSEILGEGKEGFPQIFKSCNVDECLELGKKEVDWDAKRGKGRKGIRRRGIGVAIAMQGSGIPGVDMGSAFIKINDDGSFNLNIGATDLGTGSDTILAQIAAEELGVGVDKILVYSSDTDLTPFDTGAYASSTTYISGGAVQKTAADVKRQIIEVAATLLEVEPGSLSTKDGMVQGPNGKSISFSKVALHSLYEGDQYQIMATGSHMSYECPPPFTAQFAEVEVDTETGQVDILNFLAIADPGVAINPPLCEGQVEGGVHAGIGYGLCEEMLFDDKGRMTNPSFLDYKILTARDWPKYKTILLETNEPTGPFGAKSISELPTSGPAPALANAIADALGFRMNHPPFTPEKVLRAIVKHGLKDD